MQSSWGANTGVSVTGGDFVQGTAPAKSGVCSQAAYTGFSSHASNENIELPVHFALSLP